MAAAAIAAVGCDLGGTKPAVDTPSGSAASVATASVAAAGASRPQGEAGGARVRAVDPAFLTIDDTLYIEFKKPYGADYPTLHAHDGAGHEFNLNNRHRTVIVETLVGETKTVKVKVKDAKAKLANPLEVRGLFLDKEPKSSGFGGNCMPAGTCREIPLTINCGKNRVSYAAFHVITTRGSTEHVGDPLVIIVPKEGSCKKK